MRTKEEGGKRWVEERRANEGGDLKVRTRLEKENKGCFQETEAHGDDH